MDFSFCTRTATDKGKCHYPTCSFHKNNLSYRVAAKKSETIPNDRESVYARSVAVTGLDLATTHEELWKQFKEVGNVCWMNIVHCQWTGKPKGVAYLTFTNADSARRALFLTKSFLRGAQISVCPAVKTKLDDFPPPMSDMRILTERSFSDGMITATDREEPVEVVEKYDPEDAFGRSVRVDNLSKETTAKELFIHFRECGEIMWLSIVHDEMTGKPLGHAFLTFCKAESAQKALKFSFISDLHGRIMRVFPKERKAESGFVEVAAPTTPLSESFSFGSSSADVLKEAERTVTVRHVTDGSDEQLRHHFGKCGKIGSLKRILGAHQTYSIVFEHVSSVPAAVALTGTITLADKPIEVQPAVIGLGTQAPPVVKAPSLFAEIMHNSLRKILVRPVDASVHTETALWYYFKQCGAIESCRVVPDLPKTASITFYSQSAVVKAMALNKSSFQDREIQVSFVRDDGTYAPLLPSEETIKKTKPPKENDFMEHLKFTLDVFPEPNAVQNLIDVGKFVAEGGDLSTVGVHQGLTGQPCACVKCDLHKKLMTAGAILSHAYMVYEEAEESSDDDSCGCEGC